jgi:signal transduction histidine kinase
MSEQHARRWLGVQLWRRPRAEATAEERANLFMVVLLGLQRLSYLPPCLLSLAAPGYRSPALNAALVGATLTWNAVLFWQVRGGRWFRPAMVWVDVAWATCLVVLITENIVSPRGTAVNWSGRMAQAAAALAGAAISQVALAVAAVTLLLAAQTAVAVMTPHFSAAYVPELLSALNGYIWFAVVIGIAARYLRRQGSALDQLTEQRLAAESQRAADEARYEARLDHYRSLHDTVLPTLIAIARGGLDHRTEQVRQRCARDADHIRRLLVDDQRERFSRLNDKLSSVVTDAEALGIRVHYRRKTAAEEPPHEVVDALGDATREALNNVAKHAGVDTAWVTAMWWDDTLTVRIVDRGCGFDPETTAKGFGLPWSLAERVRAVGAQARVSSQPGEGTCVELTWQR